MSSSTTNQPRVSMAHHPWPPSTAKALEGNAVNVSLGNTEDTGQTLLAKRGKKSPGKITPFLGASSRGVSKWLVTGVIRCYKMFFRWL